MFDRSRAYRQIVRGVLGEYSTMRQQLETLPERIATENARLISIRSASSESEPVTGSGANSRQERDTAIISYRDSLIAALETAENDVRCIETALNGLNDMERRTIELMDIQRQPHAVDRLCAEFGYEKTKVYNIHDSALDKFSMLYNGAK